MKIRLSPHYAPNEKILQFYKQHWRELKYK